MALITSECAFTGKRAEMVEFKQRGESERAARIAVGETVIVLQPRVPLVGVSIWKRGVSKPYV